MINTQVLKGNFISQDYSTAFTLSQGDKGVPFKIELLENGTPYTLLSGDIVVIEWLKPNGNPFLQEGGIKYGTNYIEFTTPEAVAQYSGTGTFNIIITNNNVRKGTIRREYRVVPTSMKPGSVSEDTITDAITELRELSLEIADTVQNNQDLINNNQVATQNQVNSINTNINTINTNINSINASLEDNANKLVNKNINNGFVNLENKRDNKILEKQYDNENTLVMTEKNISYVFENDISVDNIILHGKSMYVKNGEKYKFRSRNSNSSNYMNTYIIESIGETEKSGDNYVLKIKTETTGSFSDLNTVKEYTINSPVPLRSVYGDYDILDIKNKKITQVINSITINGNFSFIKMNANTDLICFRIPFIPSKMAKPLTSYEYSRKYNTVMSSDFNTHCTPNSVYSLEHCGVALIDDGMGLIFTLPKSLVGDNVDAIKTYFTNNPTTIQYPLLKPITHDLTITDNSFITVTCQKNRLKVNCTNDIQGLVTLKSNTDMEDVRNFYKNERFVNYNGKLKVVNSEVCNQFDTPFQLRGMSTFHLNKSNQTSSYNMFKTLKLYGCNYIRVVNYLNNALDGSKGYLEDADNLKTKIKELVNHAIDLDMYVCIDWHGLMDNNPLDNITEAKAFFTEMVTEFKDYPNVIYELFNEPPESCWSTQLVPYYNEVIPLIRNIDPDALLIIGTEGADSDLSAAISSPLAYDNIVYCYHTYAYLMWKFFVALSANIPLFISEWGVGDASTETQSSANYPNAEGMLKEWEKYGISWAMWSLTSREGCHNFSEETQDGGLIGDDLSTTGKFIVNYF